MTDLLRKIHDTAVNLEKVLERVDDSLLRCDDCTHIYICVVVDGDYDG